MCTNETYARLYFILQACKHFHDHIQAVLNAIEYGMGDAALKQADWVVTFTEDRELVEEAVGCIFLYLITEAHSNMVLGVVRTARPRQLRLSSLVSLPLWAAFSVS